MTDAESLRAIADMLDAIDETRAATGVAPGNQAQCDLRRIADSLEVEESAEWLVLDDLSLRLADIEMVERKTAGLMVHLVSGYTQMLRVQADEADELLALIRASRP